MRRGGRGRRGLSGVSARWDREESSGGFATRATGRRWSPPAPRGARRHLPASGASPRGGVPEEELPNTPGQAPGMGPAVIAAGDRRRGSLPVHDLLSTISRRVPSVPVHDHSTITLPVHHLSPIGDRWLSTITCGTCLSTITLRTLRACPRSLSALSVPVHDRRSVPVHDRRGKGPAVIAAGDRCLSTISPEFRRAEPCSGSC